MSTLHEWNRRSRRAMTPLEMRQKAFKDQRHLDKHGTKPEDAWKFDRWTDIWNQTEFPVE